MLATHVLTVFALRGDPSVDQEIRKPAANPSPPAIGVAGVPVRHDTDSLTGAEPALYPARYSTRAAIMTARQSALATSAPLAIQCRAITREKRL